MPEYDTVPGDIVAIHSVGDFLGWHPHLHVLCSDGCFLKHLEETFRHKVFKMLLSKERITEDLVDILMSPAGGM